MTNEEILKRLAEIEGWQWLQQGKDNVPSTGWRDSERCLKDPFTNPADTYALIEKHELTIDKDSDDPEDRWVVHKRKRWGLYPPGVHESLAMAVCLAVIEAHSGQG